MFRSRQSRLLFLLSALALLFSACTPRIEVPSANEPIVELTLERLDAGMIAPQDTVRLRLNRPLPAGAEVLVAPAVPFVWSVTGGGLILELEPDDAWEYDTAYTVHALEASTSFRVRSLPRVRVFAGGDILLDKRPGEVFAKEGPEAPFLGLMPLLTAVDLRFANLENPISDRGQPVQKNFRFRSPPESVQVLTAAGFDVLSFSNNHTFDFGEEAVLDTLDVLTGHGIAPVGVGRNEKEALAPVVVEVDGVRIAFLAFMQRTILPAWSPPLWAAGEDKPGVVFLDGDTGRQTVLAAVSAAAQDADAVFVSLHWGFEGTRAPQSWQVSLAREIIDAGADAIIGHHPHLPFGVETYRGGLIIYSLGNLLFHPYDPEARDSFVATLEVTPHGLVAASLHPIRMTDGRTSLLLGEDAEHVLKLIQERSQALGTVLERSPSRLIVRDLGAPWF